jgi:hypothetical protein
LAVARRRRVALPFCPSLDIIANPLFHGFRRLKARGGAAAPAASARAPAPAADEARRRAAAADAAERALLAAEVAARARGLVDDMWRGLE